MKKTILYSATDSGPQYDFFFISPVKIEEDFEGPPVEDEKNNTNLILGLSIFAIILIFMLGYFILHKWYSTKYEKHLFPNKNQLYNTIVYVNNSLNKGMEKEEIKKNLSKAGWKTEQINYILKKYAGKNVGMPSFSSKSNSHPKKEGENNIN